MNAMPVSQPSVDAPELSLPVPQIVHLHGPQALATTPPRHLIWPPSPANCPSPWPPSPGHHTPTSLSYPTLACQCLQGSQPKRLSHTCTCRQPCPTSWDAAQGALPAGPARLQVVVTLGGVRREHRERARALVAGEGVDAVGAVELLACRTATPKLSGSVSACCTFVI